MQFAEMASSIRKNYLLVIVSDFFALFEECYQRPARQSERIEYEFIHAVLCAAEKGATPEKLRQGVEIFCLALPSYEAGLILFDGICV